MGEKERERERERDRERERERERETEKEREKVREGEREGDTVRADTVETMLSYRVNPWPGDSSANNGVSMRVVKNLHY